MLRRINDEFAGRMALNCWVLRPGADPAGDPVELVESSARPEQVGGWIVGAPYDVEVP